MPSRRMLPDLFLQEVDGSVDVRHGAVADLALDGEEALIADVVQRRKVPVKRHATLAQRNLEERRVGDPRVLAHKAVDGLRVGVVQAAINS